jgi:nucleoid-associated protein YgaU
MKKFNLIVFMLFFSTFTALLSCESPVPIREMSLAKMEITRALSVKADKYAPKELKEAQDKLYECHQIIKKEDLEAAKKAAALSHQKAVEAYNKAIPLLAKDTLEIAEKSMEEANEVYAEVLAQNEYAQAQNTLKTSQDLYENKQYYESYLNSVNADREAKNARNVALAKKNTLQDAIDEVKITLSEAKKYNADKFAPQNVKLAEENVELAGDSLGSLKLKKGFSAVEVAKINADEALIKSLKGTSDEKLSSAGLLLAKAEKSRGAKIAKDELEGAREAYNNGKSSHSDSKYKEAISASDESMRLSRTVVAAKLVKKIEEPEEKVELSEGEQEYATYKVLYNPKRRDCLWRIAVRYYQNGYLWTKIYEANKEKIKNPDLIYPDQEFKIPLLKKSVEKEGEVPAKEEKAIKEEEKEDIE